MNKLLSLTLTFIILLSDIAVPITYAMPLIDKPEHRPIQKAIASLSTKTELSPEVLGIANINRNQSSAKKRSPLQFSDDEQDAFKADEEVIIRVNNPDNEQFTTKVVTAKGEEKEVALHTIDKGLQTEIQIDSSNQFTPGKYTLELTDQTGTKTTQDFTWGVLAMNTDRSMYLPNQQAELSFAVLDEKGEMVCDAEIRLQITKPDGQTDILTTDEKHIITNEECHSKEFTLEPDYEASYQVGGIGEYKAELTAATKNNTYTIHDSFHVQNELAFDIKRTSATRIYPPLVYPVNLEITANQDFDGTVTETVPESFTITPSDEANSYDKMNTLYFNSQKDPANRLHQKVLGSSTGLVMPFDGTYQITQGFGTEMTDDSLKNFYSHYGLGGHDGVDFGLPTGTPLYAVDDGNILVAGVGDYGITIVIQHKWGRSYYGHLSKVNVESHTSVPKGSLLGYSGNTGESTGPHLHFGMKPENPDANNGYAGKIDPLPFLPQEGTSPAKTLNLDNLQAVLSASASAKEPVQEASLIEPAVAPEDKASIAQINETSSDKTTKEPVKDYTIQDDQIRKEVSYSTSPKIEKVKVIKWQVSIKKGEKITLSYAYKAPQVSPQFYTVGPLKFFNQSGGNVVLEEKRAWQIAADAIGVDWYNKSWQYRKSVTIDKDKIGAIRDPWCNIATGATCTTSWTARRKITLDNSASGTSLTNFPILVVLNSSRIDYANTQSAGQDLRFVDADGTTLLSYEIEEFNESGNDYVWVKIPTLNTGSSDFIWMYYGNAGASAGASATNVWDSNHRMVYHMNDATGASMSDSTSNNKDGAQGTAGSQPTKVTTGLIDGNFDFDGTSDTMPVLSPNLPTGDFTFEAWVNLDNNVTRNILSILNGTSTNALDWFIGSDSVVRFTMNNSAEHETSSTIPTGQWRQVVITRSGSTVRGYINGAVNGTDLTYSTAITYGGTCALVLGADVDGTGSNCTSSPGNWMDGDMDEMRISAVSRSGDWIEAEYLSGTDAMNTFAAEETQSGGAITLTNFPVLINLASDAQLPSKAQTDGDDILFTDSTGRVKIPHEIESYNSGTGALIAWVKPSSVNNQTDTDVYMYYGNPIATNQQDAANVWDSSYRAVYHMNTNPAAICTGTSEICDSTSNNNDGDSRGTMASGDLTTGRVGNGIDFDGIDDAFQIPDTGNTLDVANITMSFWVRRTVAANDVQFMGRQSGTGAGDLYQSYVSNIGNYFFNANPIGNMSSSATGGDVNTWVYVSHTYNGSTISFYKNGVLDDSTGTSGSISSDTSPLCIASGANDATRNCIDDFITGMMDEVRLSNTARSIDWVGTEYTNQNSPSTFYSLGSEETYIYAPTNSELMRHGKFFDSSGGEQPFAY